MLPIQSDGVWVDQEEWESDCPNPGNPSKYRLTQKDLMWNNKLYWNWEHFKCTVKMLLKSSNIICIFKSGCDLNEWMLQHVHNLYKSIIVNKISLSVFFLVHVKWWWGLTFILSFLLQLQWRFLQRHADINALIKHINCTNVCMHPIMWQAAPVWSTNVFFQLHEQPINSTTSEKQEELRWNGGHIMKCGLESRSITEALKYEAQSLPTTSSTLWFSKYLKASESVRRENFNYIYIYMDEIKCAPKNEETICLSINQKQSKVTQYAKANLQKVNQFINLIMKMSERIPLVAFHSVLNSNDSLCIKPSPTSTGTLYRLHRICYNNFLTCAQTNINKLFWILTSKFLGGVVEVTCVWLNNTAVIHQPGDTTIMMMSHMQLPYNKHQHTCYFSPINAKSIAQLTEKRNNKEPSLTPAATPERTWKLTWGVAEVVQQHLGRGTSVFLQYVPGSCPQTKRADKTLVNLTALRDS